MRSRIVAPEWPKFGQELTWVRSGYDQIATCPALAGPDLVFLRARLSHRRGDLDTARRLTSECLVELPGHKGFLEFARQIKAPLPPLARRIAREREQATSLQD